MRDGPRPPKTPSLVAVACFAVALLVGWVADRLYFANGVDVAFYTTVANQRELVTRTVEHRVAFENRYRALSRIVQGWPFDRLEIPPGTPQLDAEITARVRVPPGPPMYFSAFSADTVGILVDGAPVPADGIAPGDHRISFHWRGDFGESTRFVPAWGSMPSSLDEIPRTALVPATGAWPTSRISWWLAVVALAVALSWVFARIPRVSGARRGRAVELAALTTILVVGFAFRFIDYDVMPEYRENADEAFVMWNGWSLLEEGVPRGWTPWRHIYEGHGTGQIAEEWAFGVDYRVATPYFDHPPLMHLLAGLANHAAGTNSFLATRLRDARLVAIALSLIALALTMVLARRIDPLGPAPWVAGGLYATLPFLALQQRVVKEECLLTVLALSSVLAFLQWRDRGRRERWLLVAAVFAGLCPITKIPGAVFIPALLVLVFATGEARAAARAGAVALAVASTLLVYGAAIDWEVFTRAWEEQRSTRPLHFNVFLRWFDDPLVNHNLVGRGWLLFLWLGTMASGLARRGQEMVPLAVFFAFYYLAISIGSGNWTYGWYAAPWYPALCIGAARYLVDLWRRPSLFGGVLFLTLFVFYSLNFIVDPVWAQHRDAWPLLRPRVSAVAAIGALPFMLAQLAPRSVPLRWLARAALVAGATVYLVIAAFFVARYEVLYDTYRNFDRVVFFDR